MASADFAEGDEDKRPTVQVGDPFTEKLLIEACLELMASDAIVAIQDMGAAGLTSSSVEMASKGGVGIELDMNSVPVREEGMTPYEMMLSESQERMLMVLKPGREAEAEAIFQKWELDFAVIGKVTETGHMVLKWNGETVCDIPLAPLADDAPLYDRPYVSQEEYKAWAGVKPLSDVPESSDIAADLVRLMGSPDLASRRWIWEQYDHMVGANTVQRPGGDAAVVRVHGTHKALAMCTDVTPRYCFADPVEGGRQAVAECWRNLTAVGSSPIAITNCLNFANPQRPEIMAQLVGCLEGMAEACRALDFPIVSGNVSLYNESKATGGGSAILPTPAIGGIGLLKQWDRSATIAFKNDGDDIWLIGDTAGHLGQSLWLREIAAREEGAAPPVDLQAERRNGDCVRALIAEELVTAVHDVSDGGLLVALTEMALAGRFGAGLDKLTLDRPDLTAFLFGEDQARYIVTTSNSDPVVRALARAKVPHSFLGSVGGDSIALPNQEPIPLEQLRGAHEAFFPKLMGGSPTVA
jgi:phosphoribosylformylglycinamidine synthase